MKFTMDATVVYKSFSFCAAHRLLNHPGECKQLHGHNYNVTIGVTAEELNKDTGMIIDFGDLKQIVGSWLDDLFDHTTILQEGDPLIGKISAHTPVFIMRNPPTAENMAAFMLDKLQLHLEACSDFMPPLQLVSVSVEETKNNVATVSRTRIQ